MGEGDRPGGGPEAAGRRLTVAEAAEALGITAEAVRSRIKRRTLTTNREGGTVYVVLSDTDRAQPVGDRARPGDEPPSDRTDALIDELRDRVRALEEANSENRRIIAALTSRIPAIEAPPDAPGSPETAERGPERDQPRPDAPGPQEGTARRPWWRRVFGG